MNYQKLADKVTSGELTLLAAIEEAYFEGRDSGYYDGNDNGYSAGWDAGYDAGADAYRE